MKVLQMIILSCLVAAALCAPLNLAARLAPAVLHEEVHDEFGQFHLRYVTAEGTVVSQRGKLVPTPQGDYVLVISGYYSFVGDDGKTYSIQYTSNTEGFKPEGEHLPKAPVV